MSLSQSKPPFLDHDGVANVGYYYVYRREDVRFQEGVSEPCAAARALGYLIIIVTNQAGIWRGYYTDEQFLELAEQLTEQFRRHQVEIARVYYCPHHPAHGVGEYMQDSPNQKPKPDMLLRAKAEFNLDRASSILIGDRVSDIRAAAAGAEAWILRLHAGVDTETSSSPCDIFRSLDDIRESFFSQFRSQSQVLSPRERNAS